MIRDWVAETEPVELAEGAEEALIKRTRTAESAPEYIKAAIEAASEAADQTLTVAEIEDLPDTVAGIWRDIYKNLNNDDPGTWDAEGDVLVAMKLLYDLNVPLFSKLVHDIYLNDDLVDGDPSRFKTAVKQLAGTRRWLTVMIAGDDDLLATETYYASHDAQLEAVSNHATDRIEPLSTVLRQNMTAVVPGEARAAVHFYAGVAFYECEAFELAGEHWSAAIREDPEHATAHTNYATLLAKELNDPDQAAEHYEQALEVDSEDAVAHSNYAVLLENELNNPDQAAEHYEHSVAIWRSRGQLDNAINDLSTLVAIHSKRDDDNAAIEAAADGVELAIRADDDQFWGSVNTILDAEEAGASPVTLAYAAYRAALWCVTDNRGEAAYRLFALAFRCRHDSIEGEALRRARSAGVGLLHFTRLSKRRQGSLHQT